MVACEHAYQSMSVEESLLPARGKNAVVFT